MVPIVSGNQEKPLSFTNVVETALRAFFVGIPWKLVFLPRTRIFSEPAGKHQVTFLRLSLVSS